MLDPTTGQGRQMGGVVNTGGQNFYGTSGMLMPQTDEFRMPGVENHLAYNPSQPPGTSTPGASGKGLSGLGFNPTSNLPQPPTAMAPQSGTPGRPVPAAPFTPRGPGHANPGGAGVVPHPMGDVPATPPMQGPGPSHMQSPQMPPDFLSMFSHAFGLGGKGGGQFQPQFGAQHAMANPVLGPSSTPPPAPGSKM
jgi:hypothetical protein